MMRQYCKRSLGVFAGVFLLSLAGVASAGEANVWEHDKPSINIHSSEGLQGYDVDFSMEMQTGKAPNLKKQKIAMVIPYVQATQFFTGFFVDTDWSKTTLTFNTLQVKHKGRLYSNCDLLQNPSFVPRSSTIDVDITSDGCVVR